MAIKDKIEGYSKTYNNKDVSSMTTVEKELSKLRLQYRKEEAKRVKEMAVKQAGDIHKIELAHGKVTAKELAQLNKKYEQEEYTRKIQSAKDIAKEENEARKAYYQAIIDDTESSLKDKLGAITKSVGENAKESLGNAVNKLANLGDALTGDINSIISTYSQYQSDINARLQGARGSEINIWKEIETKLSDTVGATPYLKTQTLYDNLSNLVDIGIAYDIEQRAFLETISDEIATTFDAANASLLRIVRLQQSDSTAARLGFEAYLTKYLNNSFQNTEYLTNQFDNVSAALLEASATMSTEASVEFEYQVQKWLGSLYSVGLSDDTVNKLAQAIGYLGSGDINSLEGSSMQNLIVMAASNSNLDYAKMLSEGLDAKTTNTLLEAIVKYVKELTDSNSSQVVRSQLASTFGISISDMTAIAQLSQGNTIAELASNYMDYSSSIASLSSQLNTVSERMNISEKLENVFGNSMFSLGKNIAESTALYSVWKITDMIQGVTGGINIPAINVLGSGVDLNTTVENLMKLGVVGISSLGMIGDIITGVSNTGDSFSNVLEDLGISNNVSTLSRGEGLTSLASGTSAITSSRSAMIGNSSGSDLYEQTMSAQTDESNQQLADAKAESNEKSTTDMYNYFTATFDPKLNVIVQMLAKISDSNLTIKDNPDNLNLAESILEMGSTTVKISQTSADGELEAKEALISNIDENVSKIYNLLNTGTIKVVIDNGSLINSVTGLN